VDDPPTPILPAGETKKEFAVVEVHQQQFFAGPLPPPDLLREYDRIAPGFADRIIRMAETEGAHRRNIQAMKAQGSQAARTRGQYLAWSLAVLIALLGAFLIYTGHELSGFGVLIAAIVPLVTPFLLARVEDKEQAAIVEAIRQLGDQTTEEEHEEESPGKPPRSA
jgi:uncharacterized membrane protein